LGCVDKVCILEIGFMPEGLVDIWSSGSIPWVEIILVLVVVNVLLLSGGGSNGGLLRWFSKISTPKPKKSKAAKTKTPTAHVSSRRRRAEENKGWDLAEVKGSRSQGLDHGGVSNLRKRTAQMQHKGWDNSEPSVAPMFKATSKRTRSNNRKGWSASEISEAKSSFSVSELRNRSSQRMNGGAKDAKKVIKPSRPATTTQTAASVRTNGIKSAPEGSVSLNSPLRKKGSPIRIGRRTRTR
jgi:hypothetical protein